MATSLNAALDRALKRKPPASSIYIAYSGGLDSQVLLALAVNYAKQTNCALCALHVNHGLSPNANAWQAFCADHCQMLGVPLHIKQLNLDSNQANLEQRARRARYDWFSSFMTRDTALLSAHHLDDQAETVLLRLLRGSGSKGLGAISPSRSLGEGRLIRPLLEYSKLALQQYAKEHGLKWIEDESNQNPDFDRNYLRHRVMPVLSARWPQTVTLLARSAQHCRDDQQLLDGLAEQDSDDLQMDDALSVLDMIAPISLKRFNALLRPRRRNVLQFLLRPYLEYPLSRRRMREFLNQIEHFKPDRHTKLSLNKINVSLYNNKIYFLNLLPESSRENILWCIDQPCVLESLDCVLHLEVVENNPLTDEPFDEDQSITLHSGDHLKVHWRQGGERVRQPGAQFSRALKKELQEKRVAPWLRQALPLVSNGEHIVWSAALGRLSPRLLNCDGRELRIRMQKNKRKSE